MTATLINPQVQVTARDYLNRIIAVHSRILPGFQTTVFILTQRENRKEVVIGVLPSFKESFVKELVTEVLGDGWEILQYFQPELGDEDFCVNELIDQGAFDEF